MIHRMGKLLIASALVLILASSSMAAETFIRIGTSSVGGGFYLIGNTIAQLGNADLGKEMNFTAVTGGSIKNCINLGKGEVELGMVQSATIDEAWKGSGEFGGKPVKQLRWVTAIYPMPCHILVSKSSKIKSIPDFKGKNIDFGPVGGGIEVNARAILDAFGIKEEEVKVDRFGRAEVAEALKTGRVDGHIWATNAPNAQVTDMVSSGKVALIGISQAGIKDIIKKYPFFAASKIPGGTYDGYSKDTQTVAPIGALLTSEKMDEETVYKITKMLHENTSFLQKRLNYFSDFNLKLALAGMSIPLHPGAKRYYVEKGLIKK